MKQGLQLKMGQQLAMTPQLQQAIKLLQLSNLDLQQEIQTALDENPLLSQDDECRTTEITKDIDKSQLDISQVITKQEISNEIPDGNTWDENYTPISMSSDNTNYDYKDTVYQGESINSLQDNLRWQMELSHFSQTDIIIALQIIDSINESGYLTTSCESIYTSLAKENLDIKVDDVKSVLKNVQKFDPVGVGARSAKECLQIQLRQLPTETPWLDEAMFLLELHIDLLANRDYRTLLKKTKLNKQQLIQVMHLIQSLEPRPGNKIESSQSQYIVPDVYVKKVSGKWRVSLNSRCDPHLSINKKYSIITKEKDNISQADSEFIKGRLQNAKWFIKSLESRNDTLLKVSNCIVQQQQEFFELGEEAMKPMVLNDVAFEVDMHESTISRITTQKFMHTPKGIYELKYFFSSHVTTDEGGECSSTAIRALIKKIISAEKVNKPLSDSKITNILKKQGIKVARRTIAKYRESLAIPTSSQRRQLL
ncbi:MAG: RNA polymerase factor sigma-54 [Psychromonas sp.]|nr:RNA polymerase factor sigma-54 [Psychromonas sp.]